MSEGKIYGDGFVVVPEAILYAPGVSPMAKILWGVYARHANKEGWAYPGRQRLAELIGVSPDTIKRAKAELAAAGLITVKERYDEQGRRTTDDVFLHHARCTRAPGVGGTDAPTGTRTRKNEISRGYQGAKTAGAPAAEPTWVRPSNFVEDLDKLPEKQVELDDETKAAGIAALKALRGRP